MRSKLASAAVRAFTVVSLLGLAGQAMGIGPELIISTIPTHSSSLVPGGTTERMITDFGQLCKSPSGNRWLMQCRADLGGFTGEVLISGLGNSPSTAFRSDVEAPWQPTGSGILPQLISILDQYGINDSGDLAFGCVESAQDVLVLKNSGGWTVKAREGQPIPFDVSGRVWPGSGFDVAGVSASGGQVSYRVANANTVPATTAATYLVVNDVPVAQTGVTMPTGQLTSPARAYDALGASTYFRVSATGAQWVAFCSLAGATANDDITVLSNNVVVQESFPFSTSSANQRMGGPDISGTGAHWFIRGQDTTGTVNWSSRNGVIVATTGGPITTNVGETELWANVTGFSRTFFQIVGNDSGNYVIIGGTNAAAPGNAVAVYNRNTVLLRQGAPLDVDNNGLYDDNVFMSMADTGSELYTSFLSNDGYFYTTVAVADGVGTDLGEALVRIPVPAGCPGDFNGVGGITVQDIFDFLAAWFGNNPSADFNHVAGITVQDIFDYLAAWFAGC